MKSNYFFKEEFRDVVNIIHFMAWYKMDDLAKSINYYKDGIKTSLCHRKP